MLDKPHSDWTFDEARDRLDEVVEAAGAGAPQTVTRGGQAVVVVAAAEFERMMADRRAMNRAFAEHLLAFPQLPEGAEDFVLERLPMRMRDVEF